MKGVILAPLLAAFLGAAVAGPTGAAVGFVVTLALAALVIYQNAKTAPTQNGQGRNNHDGS